MTSTLNFFAFALVFSLLPACGNGYNSFRRPTTYHLTIVNDSEKALKGHFGVGGSNNSAGCDIGGGNSTIVPWSTAPASRDSKSITLHCVEPSQTGAWASVDDAAPLYLMTGQTAALRCDTAGCALGQGRAVGRMMASTA